MPNPRYLKVRSSFVNGELKVEWVPTRELLEKLRKAKVTYFKSLDRFCDENVLSIEDYRRITEIYLIGSHAEEEKWNNDSSDIDFKLLIPNATPAYLLDYKRRFLDPVFKKSSKKKDWIDLYFAQRDDQIFLPRYGLIEYWNEIKLN